MPRNNTFDIYFSSSLSQLVNFFAKPSSRIHRSYSAVAVHSIQSKFTRSPRWPSCRQKLSRLWDSEALPDQPSWKICGSCPILHYLLPYSLIIRLCSRNPRRCTYVLLVRSSGA